MREAEALSEWQLLKLLLFRKTNSNFQTICIAVTGVATMHGQYLAAAIVAVLGSVIDVTGRNSLKESSDAD